MEGMTKNIKCRRKLNVQQKINKERKMKVDKNVRDKEITNKI